MYHRGPFIFRSPIRRIRDRELQVNFAGDRIFTDVVPAIWRASKIFRGKVCSLDQPYPRDFEKRSSHCRNESYGVATGARQWYPFGSLSVWTTCEWEREHAYGNEVAWNFVDQIGSTLFDWVDSTNGQTCLLQKLEPQARLAVLENLFARLRLPPSNWGICRLDFEVVWGTSEFKSLLA